MHRQARKQVQEYICTSLSFRLIRIVFSHVREFKVTSAALSGRSARERAPKKSMREFKVKCANAIPIGWLSSTKHHTIGNTNTLF